MVSGSGLGSTSAPGQRGGHRPLGFRVGAEKRREHASFFPGGHSYITAEYNLPGLWQSFLAYLLTDYRFLPLICKMLVSKLCIIYFSADDRQAFLPLRTKLFFSPA